MEVSGENKFRGEMSSEQFGKYRAEIMRALYGGNEEDPAENTPEYFAGAEKYAVSGEDFFDFPIAIKPRVETTKPAFLIQNGTVNVPTSSHLQTDKPTSNANEILTETTVAISRSQEVTREAFTPINASERSSVTTVVNSASRAIPVYAHMPVPPVYGNGTMYAYPSVNAPRYSRSMMGPVPIVPVKFPVLTSTMIPIGTASAVQHSLCSWNVPPPGLKHTAYQPSVPYSSTLRADAASFHGEQKNFDKRSH